MYFLVGDEGVLIDDGIVGKSSNTPHDVDMLGHIQATPRAHGGYNTLDENDDVVRVRVDDDDSE